MHSAIRKVCDVHIKKPKTKDGEKKKLKPDELRKMQESATVMLKKEKLETKVIAASVKNRKDAVALAGCDYVLLNDRVVSTLNSELCVDGSLKNAFANNANVPAVGEIYQERFEAAVANSPAAEEMAFALAQNAAADAKLKEFIKQKVLPGVGQ